MAPAHVHVAAIELVGEREHLVMVGVLGVLNECLPAPPRACQPSSVCMRPAASACNDSIVPHSSVGPHRGMLAFAYPLRTMADCAADVYPYLHPVENARSVQFSN